MFTFSTIQNGTDVLTTAWNEQPIYNTNGTAITAAMKAGGIDVRFINLVNASGTDRFCRVSGGAPFIVANGQKIVYDLQTNLACDVALKIEWDTATFTGLYAWG